MNPSLVLALAVAAAPGESDVRPVAPVDRVPAAGPPAKLDALARYGAGRLGVGRGQLPAAAKDLEAAARADPAAVAPLRDLVAVYTDLGRDPAAIRTARRVLAADPADADTAHALAKLLFAAKRYKEAGDALAAAVDSPRLDGRPTKRLAVLRDLARCREAGDDPAAAADVLRKAAKFLADNRAALRKDGFTPVEIDRQAADAAERLGRALVRREQFDEAAAAFRTAHQLAADPARANDPAAAARLDWNLSSVLQAKGDVVAALAHLTRYLDRKPPGVEPYERLAELLRATGRGGDVVAALRARAAADPANPTVRWLAAVELLGADFPAGHEEVRRLAAESADPAFYRAAARAYVAAGRPRELLDLLDARFTDARPKEDGPDDAPPAEGRYAPTERARLLSEAVAGEGALAPAVIRQAADDLRTGTVRRAETVELVAWLAERTGRLEQAEGLLRAAVRGPAAEKAAVPFALLSLLARQRKWEEVIDVCAAATDPRRGQRVFYFYYGYKAQAEAELGRAEAALATLDPIIKNPEGRRQKARVLGVLGKFREMADESAAAMEEFSTPDQVQAMRYLLADAYLGLRQFDRADAELRKILEEDPDDVQALNNLGYNLADQGRKLAEAEEMVRRAVELDRDARARVGLAQADTAAYLDSLGWVLFRRGKLADARGFLERAAGLPDGAGDPTVWDHLGDVCFRLGDKAKAKAAWAKAAGLYENSHVGRQLGRLDEVKRKRKLVE